jgi:FHA domain-containing protein
VDSERQAGAALAFVEVLGRHDDVLARHPVYRWPARAGRSYDADIILDDPFIAPRHIEIESLENGRFKVSDLQSVNGICLPPSSSRVGSAEVGPDDVVRLGQTQIRVRAPSYAVGPELKLRATALYRRPASFAIAAVALLALVLWSAWITTIQPEQRMEIVFPAISTAISVAIWVSIWALVGRAVGGRANFAAHGFVVCAALIAFALSDTLVDYFSFAFHAGWAGPLGFVVAGAILAYMLYRQLRLNSRASRRRLGIAAVLTAVLVFGGVAGLDQASEWQREGMQRYDGTLKPPVFLMVPGVTPEAFVADGERLKRKVDAMARTDR